jgi:hypothetical protein
MRRPQREVGHHLGRCKENLSGLLIYRRSDQEIRPEPCVGVLVKDSLSLGVSRSSSRAIGDIHAAGEMLRTSTGSNL